MVCHCHASNEIFSVAQFHKQVLVSILDYAAGTLDNTQNMPSQHHWEEEMIITEVTIGGMTLNQPRNIQVETVIKFITSHVS